MSKQYRDNSGGYIAIIIVVVLLVLFIEGVP